MIVDAHLHVWRPALDFPDPAATTVSPLCDVPVELLEQYMAEHEVDRAVLVQPLYPGEDNSYVADCAAAQPEKFRAVCVVDPRSKPAPSTLEYWVRQRGCTGLRLRPRVAEEAGCFGDASTFPLWEMARDLNVVISILGDVQHLHAMGQLARRFPEVAMVIDHMAHPDVERGVDSPEFLTLLSLSQFPRVFVKVSGFSYYSRQGYPFADCGQLVRAVYNRFGAERLIWGSDFPHILLQTPYQRSRRHLERAFDYLSPKDLQLIMGENAARLYWGIKTKV